MILILFLFMPVAACFGWLIVNYFLARRTNTYGILTALLLVLGLFLITDSTYANPEVKSYHLVYMRLLEVFTAPCIIPLMWMYLYRLKEKEKFKNWHFSWVIVPFILITAGGLITHLKGTDNIAGYLEEVYSGGLSTARIAWSQDHLLFAYYLWTGLIYRIVISIELLAGFVMVLYYTRKYSFSFKGFQKFRRKGEPIPVLHIQFVNMFIPIIIVAAKIILLNNTLQENVWISFVLSLMETACIFNFAFTALFGAREKITREQMNHVLVYNYNDKIKSVMVDFTMDDLLDETTRDGLKRLRSKIDERLGPDDEEDLRGAVERETLISSMSTTWDEDSLLSRFQSLMIKEQLFLQPGLTLSDVADRLRTNKTYISKLVNNTYNLGFPELLNTLRVDYAEQYIITHRNAKQEEIATACGFPSASSFNSTFKKVTGMTPKVWIAGVLGKAGKSARI